MKTQKNSVQKIETYLPLFSGFYNTIWDLDETQYLDSENLEYDDIEIDYIGYMDSTCKTICEFVEDNCPFIESVKFQKVISPREYNFINDSCNVEITLNVTQLKDYVIENRDSFDVYLKERYTSCSGFISSYDNNFEGWFENTKGFTEFGEHELGSCLDFYFENEYIEECDVFESSLGSYNESDFITSKFVHVDNLESWDLQTVAFNVFDEIDKNWGYFAVLLKEYEDKAVKLGAMFDAKTLMCEAEYNFIIKEAGVTKVHSEDFMPKESLETV